MSKPKILLLDIETAPIEAYVWGLYDQNIGLNMIKQDWSILAFCCKWLGEDKVDYLDARGDVRNDVGLLTLLYTYLDEADIIITHNGVKFDLKKINARLLQNGFQPPSSYKQIDTLKIAKKYFGFTSNKLEYLTNTLNIKFKKLDHSNFHGFSLWKECLADNEDAWDVMEEYNIHDVLSLEELYNTIQAWDGSAPNFSLYTGEEGCNCGSTKLLKNGFGYSKLGAYQRFKCADCGTEVRSGKRKDSIDIRRTAR